MRKLCMAGFIMLIGGALSAQVAHEWSFSAGVLYPSGEMGKHFDSAMLWDISYTGNTRDPGRMVWSFKYLSKEWDFYDHDEDYGDTRGTVRTRYYIFAPTYHGELCGKHNLCPFFDIED